MHAKLLPPTESNLAWAASELRGGKIGGLPTETVYGLAAAVEDEGALARVFEVKERPTFDPLIVHIAPGGFANPLEALINSGLVKWSALGLPEQSAVELLVKQFWPGPLTLVLPKAERVPDLCTSGLPAVGIRMPSHPVAQALLALSGPLAAPSANLFGHISPTTAQHVLDELGDRIGWVIDGGPCAIGVESTVLKVDSCGVTWLRAGGVSYEELQQLLGGKLLLSHEHIANAPASAPGMLESHYAPRQLLKLLSHSVKSTSTADWKSVIPTEVQRLGLLLQSGSASAVKERVETVSGVEVVVEVLSANGDAQEAARNLFGALRRLEAAEPDFILAEPVLREEGLFRAIADRLRRAAAAKS